MGPFKRQTKMRRLKAEKGESVIPKGYYCYDEKVCPYWDLDELRPSQVNGFCWFLEMGDWEEGVSELWDQCKCCGVNYYTDKELEEMEYEEEN